MNERIGKQAERPEKAKKSFYYKAYTRQHMFKINTAVSSTMVPRERAFCGCKSSWAVAQTSVVRII